MKRTLIKLPKRNIMLEQDDFIKKHLNNMMTIEEFIKFREMREARLALLPPTENSSQQSNNTVYYF